MAISIQPVLTDTSSTDKYGIGTVYETRGKRYRWVKVDTAGAAEIASAGEVVYPASTTTWEVSNDYTGGVGLGARVVGVSLGAVDATNYCWIQISGFAPVRTAAGLSAETLLIGHTVDGEADTMAAGEEGLVFGVALTATGTAAVSGLDSVYALIWCG